MPPPPPICTTGSAAGCIKKETNTSNPLDRFRKDKDGEYWFELIPEKDKKDWEKIINGSIVEFFNTMINTGQISDEINIEYKEYIAALNKFLE